MFQRTTLLSAASLVCCTAALGVAPAAARAAQPHSFFELRGGAIELALPAGFFGSGSPAVRQAVALQGRPLRSLGAFEFGRADTALVLGSSRVPARGRSLTLPLVAGEIDWRGSRPIGVGGQQWRLLVGLSKEATQPPGQVRLRRTSAAGGTFILAWELVPRLTFIGPGGALRVVDGGLAATSLRIVLNATGVPWRARCPRAVLRVPRLSGTPCLGVSSTAGVRWQARSAGSPTVLRLQFGPVRPPVGRRARVSPSAVVGPGVRLGAGAVVGPGAHIGAGAVIGPGAVIAAGAVVDRLGVVGIGARIARRARVGRGSVASEGSRIGAGAAIGAGAVVGARTRVGSSARLGARSTIGSSSRVDSRARLGGDVIAGGDVTIGARATIDRGVFLARRASVPARARAREDLVTCIPSNNPYAEAPRPLTAAGCNLLGGSAQECLPAASSGFPRRTVGERVTPGNLAAGPKTQLEKDVDAAKVAPANGGQPYKDPEHDCDDFADELEKALQAKGYDATFTVLWELNPDYAWYNALWTSKWINGHAITDIHQADGSIVWIEPQLSSGQGAVGRNLDFDGDGKVGIARSSGSSTTDDSRRIEVYDSRAACEAAGNVLD